MLVQKNICRKILQTKGRDLSFIWLVSEGGLLRGERGSCYSKNFCIMCRVKGLYTLRKLNDSEKSVGRKGYLSDPSSRRTFVRYGVVHFFLHSRRIDLRRCRMFFSTVGFTGTSVLPSLF